MQSQLNSKTLVVMCIVLFKLLGKSRLLQKITIAEARKYLFNAIATYSATFVMCVNIFNTLSE